MHCANILCNTWVYNYMPCVIDFNRNFWYGNSCPFTFKGAKLITASTSAVEWYKSCAHTSFLSKVVYMYVPIQHECGILNPSTKHTVQKLCQKHILCHQQHLPRWRCSSGCGCGGGETSCCSDSGALSWCSHEETACSKMTLHKHATNYINYRKTCKTLHKLQKNMQQIT